MIFSLFLKLIDNIKPQYALCLLINFSISSSFDLNIETSKNTFSTQNYEFEKNAEITNVPTNDNTALTVNQTIVPEKRKWCLLAYIAADNDLHYFAWNNIKQLASGANKDIYIITQLNEPGKNKKTQLYLIEKNKAILLNKDNQQKLDSGDPQTLIDFCLFAIKNYPADNYFLILSNHGSGVIDRYGIVRSINPSEFFLLNPSNLMLELDRNIEFLNFLEKPRSIDSEYDNLRGLCFDETYQTYLTNQKLEYALKTICLESAKYLNKKDFKFSIIGMDACLMQMIEEVDLLKRYANIVIASQEVELGPGWRYDKVLNIFKHEPIDFLNFAKHIVKVYEDTYSNITNDFTLSAINAEQIDELINNINIISELLIDLMQNQKDNSVKNMIKKSKTNIAFEEPSYIDIFSFFSNILKNIDSVTLKDNSLQIKNDLKIHLQNGIRTIKNLVIENVSGSNIKYANGLSIYFPEKRIHNSYRKTNFAQTNQWINFLIHYIAL